MTIDDLKRLPDSELNVRAARAAGWTTCNCCGERRDHWANGERHYIPLPDFCTDLNAVAELVEGLQSVECERFIEALATLKDWRTRLELNRCDEEMLWDFATASARDRTIAFIAAKECGK